MRREGQELSDILPVTLPSHRTASAKKPLRSQCDPLLTSALYLLFLPRSRVTHWVNSPLCTLPEVKPQISLWTFLALCSHMLGLHGLLSFISQFQLSSQVHSPTSRVTNVYGVAT